MSTGTRIPLAEAEQLAGEITERLLPACEQIMVAGSIRRRRPTVGDVEIVCVPRLDTPVIHDLFGVRPDGPPVNLLDALCIELHAKGVLGDRPDKNGRPAFGQRYKRLTYKGAGLDLFCVLEPAQWGVITTIRTGCAEFSHKLVTPRLQSGWLPTGMQVRDGQLWSGGGRVDGAETEQGLFEAIGLPWLEPEQRTETVQLWRTQDEHSPVHLVWRDLVPA